MKKRAFTLMEIAMAGAIIVALFAIIIPGIVSYVQQAQRTADKQTLTVLNDALSYYKTRGGDIDALTLGAPIGNVIERLRTPATWVTGEVQFLNSGVTYQAASLDAVGEGVSYSFFRYNTYEMEGVADNNLTTKDYNAPVNFIAIFTYSDRYFYSSTGKNWYEGTIPEDERWFFASYAGDKYFVTGNSSKYCYSTDGINWSTGLFPLYGTWQSICYGGGTYVACTGGESSGLYSSDGISWTSTTLPHSGYSEPVYGDGMFVALASNSNLGAYSLDGISWTEFTLPATADWTYLAYGGGVFVGVAPYVDYVVYSTDGINWSLGALPSSKRWRALFYGNGKFIVGGQGTTFAESSDGMTWTSFSAGCAYAQHLHGDSYGQSLVVSSESSKTLLYSLDGGANWECTEDLYPSFLTWRIGSRTSE